LIRVKVLKMDKCIYVVLFIIGIVLLGIIFKTVLNNHSTVEVFSPNYSESTDNNDKFVKDFFKSILDRAFPAMKVSAGNDTVKIDFVQGVAKFITGLNYRDPKTFIMAGLPVLGNYDVPVSRGDGEGWDRGDPYDPENEIGEILRQYDVNNVQIENEEYEGITTNSNIGEPKKTSMDMAKPVVLIYHTHTSEAYKPSKNYNYTPTDVDRTIDPRYNVVRVGKELKDTLETQYNIKVIHNTTFHDYPDYGPSYARSLNTVKGILAKYPTLKVLIDIHRDALPMRSETEIAMARKESVLNYNGKVMSKVMLVWGPNTDNSKETRKFAELLKNKIEQQVSGLCRKVYEKKTGKYNQHLSNYSTLIEVGSNANTMEEALRTIPYLAKAISEAIKVIEE